MNFRKNIAKFIITIFALLTVSSFGKNAYDEEENNRRIAENIDKIEKWEQQAASDRYDAAHPSSRNSSGGGGAGFILFLAFILAIAFKKKTPANQSAFELFNNESAAESSQKDISFEFWPIEKSDRKLLIGIGLLFPFIYLIHLVIINGLSYIVSSLFALCTAVLLSRKFAREGRSGNINDSKYKTALIYSCIPLGFLLFISIVLRFL